MHGLTKIGINKKYKAQEFVSQLSALVIWSQHLLAAVHNFGRHDFLRPGSDHMIIARVTQVMLTIM